MVRTTRLVGITAGILFYLFVMICGCQKDHATSPATKDRPKPVDLAPTAQSQASMPAEGSTEQSTPQTPKAQAAPPEPNEAGPPVRLALQFPAGQIATYRVTTDAQRSIEWVGPASGKPADFSDGRTGSYAEITFEQQVRQVRDDGNAVLRITIKTLKFRGEVQNKTTIDFDSGRPEDQSHPLAALIGKDYQMEVSPKGQVVAVTEAEAVRQAVQAGSPAYNVAAKLFSDETIRDRHAIPPLSALKEDSVRPGQSWSDLKSFAFGEMGLKGFERVYTLKQVRRDDGQSALVEMKAIPSAAMTEEMHKRGAGALSGLFDNTEKYEGRLDLDLDCGQVREYVEQMQAEWVIVDPAVMRDTTAQPRGLKMGAKRLHRLELVR